MKRSGKKTKLKQARQRAEDSILIDDNRKSNCTCGPDVTDWFVKEINIHVRFIQRQRLHLDRYQPSWGVYSLIFAEYAKNLHYKRLSFRLGSCPTCKKCQNTVTLCGKCIHVSELGNIMYGLVGRLWWEDHFSLSVGIEELVLSGGWTVPRYFGAAGINSTEDMAGVIAGLQIGRYMVRQMKRGGGNVRTARVILIPKVFCQLVNRRETALFGRISRWLKARIVSSHKSHSWFAGIAADPLSAMAKSKSGCSKCAKKLPRRAPNTSFTWLKRNADLAKGKQDRNYRRMYRALKWERTIGREKVEIDVSRVPR